MRKISKEAERIINEVIGQRLDILTRYGWGLIRDSQFTVVLGEEECQIIYRNFIELRGLLTIREGDNTFGGMRVLESREKSEISVMIKLTGC